MPRVVSKTTAHLFNNKRYDTKCIMHLLTAQDKILIGYATAFNSKRYVYKPEQSSCCHRKYSEVAFTLLHVITVQTLSSEKAPESVRTARLHTDP